MRVSGHRFFSASIAGATSSKELFWQIAILTAAGTVAAAPQADAAALFYLQDSDPSYYRPVPTAPPRKPTARRPSAKTAAAVKETNAKPQGPLIIAVSIDQQKVRIYDTNGLFAESPVSTGMKGHSTPMGVFSVIQKHKMHRSNIYSGAPMPYMQRITWSGVAMHAGVLPGYPASHGCIRMPMAFAIKMWNWTKMGARVVVTPGEMTPASFSHPLLVTQKALPVANDAPQVDAPLGVKSDKGADAQPAAKPIDTAETRLELRSSVGHGPLTQTADASSAMPANAAVTMSDASPAGASGEAISVKAAEVAETQAKPEAAKAEAPAATKAADAPDAKKDPSRLPGVEKAAKAEPKREGLVAVFISRKDGKLYVRQNFKPLFEVPVTIAPSDRLLGTHVFTAETDKSNPNLLRWSVVSLPVAARNAQKNEDEDRPSRRRKGAAVAPVETKPAPVPNGPAE